MNWPAIILHSLLAGLIGLADMRTADASPVEVVGHYSCDENGIELVKHDIRDANGNAHYYYSFNYLENGRTIALPTNDTMRAGLGLGVFPASLLPSQYVIFKPQAPDDAEALFGDGHGASANGIGVIVLHGALNPDQFTAMATCLARRLDAANEQLSALPDAAPITSISYVAEENAFREARTPIAQYLYVCADTTKTRLYVDSNTNYVKVVAAPHSRVVGFINDRLHFQPLNLAKIEAELQPGSPFAAARHRDPAEVAAELAAQRSFQATMAAVLPTCRDGRGLIFADAYPPETNRP